MIRNITRTSPPTPEDIAARDQWLAEQRAAADALSAQLTLNQQQLRQAEVQDKLVADTRLDLSQLQAIKTWLAANP
jgi:hypothetical protein